jgi:hypothetical protein
MKNIAAMLLIVLALGGCQKATETQTYRSIGDLSYRVDSYRGSGAISPSSTAVFAVMQSGTEHSEKLVLSGIDMDIKSIAWRSENQGFICLSGGYTETYRRIVALSISTKTEAVYTHLTDSC